MARHNVTGKFGEDYATDYLKAQGYTIVGRNFRSNVGEIDIIAKEKFQYVFVEVKTRSSRNFGAPAEAITSSKVHSLVRAGQYYLIEHNLPQNFRIDALEVELHATKSPTIHHIKNITL